MALVHLSQATQEPGPLVEAARLLVALRDRGALEVQFIPLTDQLAPLLDDDPPE